MTRFLFFSVLLLCSTAAVAEESIWSAMPTAYAGHNNRKSAMEIRLEKRKVEMLKRGDERAAEVQQKVAEIQQHQACIKAAATLESLKNCSLMTERQEDHCQVSKNQNNRDRYRKYAGIKK